MTTPANETTIIRLIESLARVDTAAELVSWVGKELHATFPHGAFVCGVGRVQRGGVSPLKLLTSNFPADYLQALKQPDGLYASAALNRWLASGEAQLFDQAESDDADMDRTWLERFRASGLRNIAAHGVYDYSRQHASYFSFHQIPETPDERHRRLLNIFVPHMHTALLRIVHKPKANAGVRAAGRTLTPRELEVLAWVCEGKTSDEIACILGVARSTVRNQIQTTLVKLRVNTRAQAAAKAIKSGLVIPRQPDSILGKKPD